MFHDESWKIITYILGSSQQQSNINSHKSLTHSEAYQSDRHHTSVESSRSNWIRLSRSSLEERPNSIATFNRQYIQHTSLWTDRIHAAITHSTTAHIQPLLRQTSISVLLIVGSKYTLTMSHAAPWWVMVSMPTGQMDGQTDARPSLHYAFHEKA